MATLQRIRNRAGLLIIVIGVALFAFIIGDGLRSCDSLSRGNSDVALTIDGEKVKIHEYDARVQQLRQSYESQGMRISEDNAMAINNMVQGQYLRKAVLDKLSKQTGITVSQRELYALTTGDGIEQSPTAQQVLASMGVDPANKQAIDDFLQRIDPSEISKQPADIQGQLRLSASLWNNFLTELANERLSSKFASAMERSYVHNKIDEQFIAAGPSRTVAVVRTPSTLLADTTIVANDTDIAAYYNAHLREYRLPNGYTKIDYIAVEIRPTASDYAAAAQEMLKARELLLTKRAEEVVNNYTDGNARKYFVPESDLTYENLSSEEIEFVKNAQVGDVNTPLLLNDNYSFIKLVGKKNAPKGIKARLILLSPENSSKADSLVNLINGGTSSFAELAAQYSAHEESKAQGGYLVQNSGSAMADSTITEMMAFQMGIDTLFHSPVGRAFHYSTNGVDLILQSAAAEENVTKYQIATMKVPVVYSEKTARERHEALNAILYEYDNNFDGMLEAAKKKGFDVHEGEMIQSGSPALHAVPSSREVISWALRGKEGEVHDKIFRCGNDFLLVARIGKRVPAGTWPMDEVQEQIKNQLEMEKRGEKLAEQLAAKNLTSLEAYAQAMESRIDTLERVDMVITGVDSPTLAGKALGSKVGMLSKPFRAETEVVVVQPLSESKIEADAQTKARAAQARQSVAQSLAYRALTHLQMNMKVVDNRGKFY